MLGQEVFEWTGTNGVDEFVVVCKFNNPKDRGLRFVRIFRNQPTDRRPSPPIPLIREPSLAYAVSFFVCHIARPPFDALYI